MSYYDMSDIIEGESKVLSDTEIEFGILGDFPYSIHKHAHLGHLCGYIAVPPSHPWFGKHYDEVKCDVHGGLTYGQPNVYGEEHYVARLKKDHEETNSFISGFTLYQRQLERELERQGDTRPYPHPLTTPAWWFGFDCGHASDISPGLDFKSSWATYKDRDYVFAEIEGMVRQAADAMRLLAPARDAGLGLPTPQATNEEEVPHETD